MSTKNISFFLSELWLTIKALFPAESKAREKNLKRIAKEKSKGFENQDSSSNILAKKAAVCFVVLLLVTSFTVFLTVVSMVLLLALESTSEIIFTVYQEYLPDWLSLITVF